MRGRKACVFRSLLFFFFGQTVSGLLIALCAPILGAFADKHRAADAVDRDLFRLP